MHLYHIFAFLYLCRDRYIHLSLWMYLCRDRYIGDTFECVSVDCTIEWCRRDTFSKCVAEYSLFYRALLQKRHITHHSIVQSTDIEWCRRDIILYCLSTHERCRQRDIRMCVCRHTNDVDCRHHSIAHHLSIHYSEILRWEMMSGKWDITLWYLRDFIEIFETLHWDMVSGKWDVTLRSRVTWLILTHHILCLESATGQWDMTHSHMTWLILTRLAFGKWDMTLSFTLMCDVSYSCDMTLSFTLMVALS